MKNFFKKIWDAIVAFIGRIPYEKWAYAVLGIILAAFFCITLGMKFCVWPAIIIGFIIQFFKQWFGGKFDWWDFAATCIGGLVPQIFVLLNMWWF